MEWLKELLKNAGIEKVEELEKSISKELPKHFKPASEFNEVNEKLKTANAEIETLKATQTSIQTEYENYKKGSITQTDYDAKVREIQEEADNKIKQNNFDNKLAIKLMSKEIDAKDVIDIKANLDLKKISLDGENFIGLDEQIKDLKERKGYLFNETTTTITGGGDGNKQKVDGDKTDTSNMTYSQMCKYLEENPDAKI